jgi:hypothetical protein
MEVWTVGCLHDLLGLFELTVVEGLVFCRWDVVERAVQAVLVPPLHPLEGGQLDLLSGAPGAARADQFGLVQPVDRLVERVDAPMSRSCWVLGWPG